MIRRGPGLVLVSRPILQQACRLCGARLKVYERPEGVCDGCLRAHQWGRAA